MPLGGRAALYYGWYAMPEGALRFASPDVTILNGSLGSNLPDDLRGLGYVVRKIGDGERILPTRSQRVLSGAPMASLSR